MKYFFFLHADTGRRFILARCVVVGLHAMPARWSVFSFLFFLSCSDGHTSEFVCFPRGSTCDPWPYSVRPSFATCVLFPTNQVRVFFSLSLCRSAVFLKCHCSSQSRRRMHTHTRTRSVCCSSCSVSSALRLRRGVQSFFPH